MNLSIKKIDNSVLDSIAEIHLETYSNVDNFSKLLGKDYVKKVYSFFINNGYGFVAHLDNKPIGFIVGLEPYLYLYYTYIRLINLVFEIIFRPIFLFITKSKNNVTVKNTLLNRVKEYCRFNKFNYMNKTFGAYNGVYICSMAILPIKEKYSIAFRLFEKLESIAVAKKKKYMIGSVGKDNFASLIFHKSLPGYSVHIDRYNKFSNEIFFVKKLNC